MGGLTTRRRALAKLIVRAVGALKPPSPRTRALATLLAGGAVTATGTALIYLPAGVILGGLQLTAFALLVINVPKDR
jgi:CBS-domain-containing membrane protein